VLVAEEFHMSFVRAILNKMIAETRLDRSRQARRVALERNGRPSVFAQGRRDARAPEDRTSGFHIVNQ